MHIETRLWILGASDPEMQAIESLLCECNEVVAYAIGPDGQRVHPGNSYKAAGYLAYPETINEHVCRGWESVTHMIECAAEFAEFGGVHDDVNTIDHHRPGDPGYGRPPAEFLSASSIGQVAMLLGHHSDWNDAVTIDIAIGGDERYVAVRPQSGSYGAECTLFPYQVALVAAADHCLAAAYRGECPGVDPDELMRWRIEARAAHQCRSAEEVLADVEAARQVLRAAPEIELLSVADMPHTEDHDWSRSACDGCNREPVRVRDLRGQRIPELPEASAREGICFVADGLPAADGRVKIVCQSGSPEQISAFMEQWAPSEGLVGVYGDPARGFAGAYLITGASNGGEE